MNRKKYNQFRVGVSFFVAMIVAMAAVRDNYLLATVGVVAGILFMALVRSKVKIKVDEREITVREKAAQLTYAIFTPTIAIGSFLLLLPTQSGLDVFSKGEFEYLESLGMILSYLTLFLIALYALSYHFLNRKYGGGNDEE